MHRAVLDEADVLAAIGGWRVGCEIEAENQDVADTVKSAGFVARRLHFAPATPDGDPAYEITAAGLSRLEAIRGPEARRRAEEMRDWYREHTSGP